MVRAKYDYDELEPGDVLDLAQLAEFAIEHNYPFLSENTKRQMRHLVNYARRAADHAVTSKGDV